MTYFLHSLLKVLFVLFFFFFTIKGGFLLGGGGNGCDNDSMPIA